MLVIIYPTGTKRTIHINHFAAEAELLDPNTIFITTEEFRKKPISDWPMDSKFVVRAGAYSIKEIYPLLNLLYHKGYTVFPSIPSIKNCLDKSIFSDICKKNDIKTPKTIHFDLPRKRGPDTYPWDSFPFWEWGKCVIKPSKGTLGNGIYFVEAEDVPDKIREIIHNQDEFYEDCDVVVQKRIINKKNIPESIRVFCFMGEPTCSITLSNSLDFYNKASSDLKVNPEILYDENGNILDSIGYDLDFETVSNLNKGGVAGPYIADEYLKEQCRKVCKATGIEFTSLDFVQDQQGEFYCLEANIAPHLYRAFVIYGGKINHPRMIFKYLLDKNNKDSIIL